MLAARELFADRGLDVTMDEIARHAGVGVGTAYRRFENRDALVAALFEERMADYVALAEDALGDPDAWNGLTTFMERSVAMQAADRGLKDLLMRHERAVDRITRMRERVRPLMEELIRRAQREGALRPDVAAPDLALLSVMLGQVIDFSHDVAPELWRRYLALLLDGLRTRREDTAALPVAGMTRAQLDAAMSGWKRR